MSSLDWKDVLFARDVESGASFVVVDGAPEPRASGMSISKFDTSLDVYGNVYLDGEIRTSNVFVSNVLEIVEIVGNVGFYKDINTANCVISDFESDVEIAGNVGFLPDAVFGNVVVSSVSSALPIRGNVGFSEGSFVEKASVYSLSAPVTVEAKLEAKGGVFERNVSIFGFENPLVVGQDVLDVASALASNAEFTGVDSDITVYGNVSIDGGITASNVVLKRVPDVVSVRGNVSVRDDVFASGFSSPVAVYGNVSVDNVSIVSFIEPIAIVGNISSSNAIRVGAFSNAVNVFANAVLTSQISVSNVVNPFRVYGNVGIIGNVAINSIKSNVVIYGNSLVGNGTLDNYEILNGRLRSNKKIRAINVSCPGGGIDAFASALATSNASVTYGSSERVPAVYLNIGSSGNGRALRQSVARAAISSVLNLRTQQSFVLANSVNGLIQQVGYFDDSDGIFLRVSGTSEPAFVRRYTISNVAYETVATRSSWSLDKLDGKGRSYKTANIYAPQTLVIYVDCPGTGKASCGFVVDGVTVMAHEFVTANKSQTRLVTNPTLPLRWEIVSSSSSASNATMTCFGGSAFVDSSYRDAFVDFSSSWYDGRNSKVEYAIRLKPGYASKAVIYPVKASFKNAFATRQWSIGTNAVVSSDGSWATLRHANSVIEYNVTRTVVSAPTDGVSGFTGNISSDVAQYDRSDLDIPPMALSTYANGTPIILSFVVDPIYGGTNALLACLTWREAF